ncbi:hypothetical protein PHYPSEUDO_010911 [Phytophthora pseudosyringae]|uniref:Uncharacterized protein n=1 Tax=Phytophthora pseudosyringae TaxID=221518 RepID=A0A8T1V9X6_9STRA|nr:hypothetical protein PHYPSEUDO_010911 [Phytophthora pseudosyringae]
MAISDNSSTNASGATQQEMSKLQEMMTNGANEASSYLDSLKAKFTDYDSSHKSSKESASTYFQTAMDRARASVDEFKRSGEDVRKSGNNASDTVVDTAKRSMDQAGSALDDLGKSAQAYDQHVRDSINSSVDDAKDSGAKTATSWQDSISSLINSTRESTFHGFEALQNQFTATQKAMADQASSAADGISTKASEASEQFKPADTKSSGQEGGPTLMERATGAVSSGVGYVTSAFQGPDDASDKKAGTKSS